MLVTRVVSATVLIPLVLGTAYLGGPYFAVLVTVAALLSGYEFYHIMRERGHEPSYVAGLTLIAVLLLDAYAPRSGVMRCGVTATVIVLMLWQILHADTQGFLTNWALTLTGALYVGGLAGHLVSLRNLPQGLGWLLLAFAGTWATDTAAYFAGTYWGRHGFFTRLSPHKTMEGALAGFMVGILATAIAGHLLGLVLWQSLLLGVFLVLGVTFGDLAESLVKRQVGVKDSSSLIPGHGGMLDRIDSLLFAGVVVYYFAVWVVGA
ncbi:MAG TPA: phosphatidate cytidylyltransferase [Anaerolineae bacterium]|nr:phosphatidate cytidylyltransferase [Anaerolineae bacterium]